MNGKFYAQFVTPLDRHERYVRIEFYILKNQRYTLGEVYFPDVNSDEVLIKFHEPNIEGDALEFIAFFAKNREKINRGTCPSRPTSR